MVSGFPRVLTYRVDRNLQPKVRYLVEVLCLVGYLALFSATRVEYLAPMVRCLAGRPCTYGWLTYRAGNRSGTNRASLASSSLSKPPRLQPGQSLHLPIPIRCLFYRYLPLPIRYLLSRSAICYADPLSAMPIRYLSMPIRYLPMPIRYSPMRY
eukprot:375294-Rhodomonas_salina.1